jgi:hypothetical protein
MILMDSTLTITSVSTCTAFEKLMVKEGTDIF